MKNLHLISGLPRSGSTLLCNLLNLNPEFVATPTSPLIQTIISIRETFSNSLEFISFNRLEELSRIRNSLKAFIFAYHSYSSDNHVFDKNRMWPSEIRTLDDILGHSNTKIIWCYRDPVQIFLSMEKQHFKTVLLNPIDVSEKYRSSRIDRLRIFYNLTLPYLSDLEELLDYGFGDRIKFINFDDLTKNTNETLNDINSFVGASPFEYSKKEFKDLKQTTFENDGIYNYKFSHSITEGSVSFVSNDINIPKYIVDEINHKFSWLDIMVSKT